MTFSKFYREIIENSNNPILLFNSKAQLIDLNSKVISSWGYKKNELMGEKFFDIVHDEDKENFGKFLLECTNSNQPKSGDFRILKANGDVVQLSGSTYVLYEEKSKQKIIALYAMDITKYKELEKSIIFASGEWRKTFDSIRDIVILIDRNNVIKRANLQLAQTLNKNVKDLIGEKCHDVMEILEKPTTGCPHIRALRSGMEETLEWYNSNLDRYFLCTAHPIKEDEKTLVGSVIIIRDITEQKRLEKDIKISEKRYRTLVENIEDIIYITDAERRLKFFNKSFERNTGYSQDELVGKKFSDLFTKKSKIIVDHIWKDQQDGEDVGIFDLGIFTKKGEEKIIETRERVLWEKDKIVLVYGLGRDVTTRKILEERLIQSEKLASMGEMLSGVAHEINNPLTSIIGNAQLLIRRSNLEYDVIEKMNTIQKESKRVYRIVQNLLSFARKKEPVREMANVNDIVVDVCEIMTYTMKVNNIQTNLNLDDKLTPTFIDINQIKQVFINILNNANDELVKIGGGEISINTYRQEDIIIIEFIDDGPGIPDDIRRKIFDPFFTTKEVGKGTGLGLSISYGIIKSHNGDIYVESETGVGTKFVISLPIVVSISNDEDQHYLVGESSVLSGKKILVVDDEKSIRNFIVELLTDEGCSVSSVSNGTEAIEKISAISYDAVMCDMKMPGISGKDLFQYIKENKPELTSKIIFVTGDMLSQDTQKFIKKTGSLAIEKPLDINAILKMLEDLFTATYDS